MHLLQTSSTSLDDLVEPIDLGQSAADMAVLSFTDSDLSSLAAAYAADKDILPSLRLAHLRDLRHPMSVDLWLDKVGQHAKVIVVRLLGGLDWWRYGVEALTDAAKARGIALAVLPGEDRDDARLATASTLPADELATLLAFFREGGRENMRAFLRRLARHAGHDTARAEPQAVPRFAGYLPGRGVVSFDDLEATLVPERPVVPILFYRAALLAADIAPIDALCAALGERGLGAAPLFVPSLKDKDARRFLGACLPRLEPAVILTTTAFAASGEGEASPLDLTDAPVLQAIMANTKRDGWIESPRGLGASDLAMHVVLPEIDGRVLVGALSFKDPIAADDALNFTALMNRPEADRIALVANRVAAIALLRETARAERRIAMLLPDYHGAAGRTGYAVGLDVPASVLAVLHDLKIAGYDIEDVPDTPRGLIAALEAGGDEAALPLADYARLAADLPAGMRARLHEAWGDPSTDPGCRRDAFHFRARWFGNVLVALPPDRGSACDRRADYHDPILPPRHALLAFGLWLRHRANPQAVLHLGAHGTLEWLPGKAVALTQSCFPEAMLGALPVIYPFIVSNPGEAAQAKRRLAGITIGHLPPPLVQTELSGPAQELERLVDEYAIADGLDRRRRTRLAKLIVEHAQSSGLAREAGLDGNPCPDAALKKIDAWLCDLKDLALKDGLHIYGRDPGVSGDALWPASAEAERAALLTALDGQRVAAGPAGAPARGSRDVLPTGRNLFTADPRVLPTPTAMDLGRLAADEVIRLYQQTHGDMPRSLVIDLWGSATLRTGGEEIAQGLALMGCRPTWDPSTGRVTGIEVLPPASMGRPRVDVTFRISGLFRDLFPAQIALLDAAVQLVAQRDEDDIENPLAASERDAPTRVARIFGNAPGAYGAGVEDLLGRDPAEEDIGAAYLAATSHVYGGADGTAGAANGAFSDRVAAADLLLHPQDDPTRDILEGAEDVSFVGGFAAAAKSLGRTPDLVMLDLTDPNRPRARTLPQALARIVRGRATSKRYIDGMMRHGYRGAAELAETVDRLADFAETTGAAASSLFDALHEAYIADRCVRDFLQRENPEAARAIAARLDAMRAKGFWHPRRNDDSDLAAMRTEAAE